jgi:hypothetical protein
MRSLYYLYLKFSFRYLRHEGCGSFADMVNDVRSASLSFMSFACLYMTDARLRMLKLFGILDIVLEETKFSRPTCFCLFHVRSSRAGESFGFNASAIAYAFVLSVSSDFLLRVGSRARCVRALQQDPFHHASIEPSSLSVDNTGMVRYYSCSLLRNQNRLRLDLLYVVPYQWTKRTAICSVDQGQRWLPKITLRDNISKLKVRSRK